MFGVYMYQAYQTRHVYKGAHCTLTPHIAFTNGTNKPSQTSKVTTTDEYKPTSCTYSVKISTYYRR